MKFLSIVLLFAVLVAGDSFAQTTSIDVSATIEAAAPTCTFDGETDLEFGDIQLPTSGDGTVTFDPTNESMTPTNGIVTSGTSQIGELSVTASNSSNVVVSYTPITSLQRVGATETAGFEVSWASSSSGSPPWSSLSDVQFTETVGTGVSKTIYFQVGGELTVASDQVLGAYSRPLSFSVSCPS